MGHEPHFGQYESAYGGSDPVNAIKRQLERYEAKCGTRLQLTAHSYHNVEDTFPRCGDERRR